MQLLQNSFKMLEIWLNPFVIFSFLFDDAINVESEIRKQRPLHYSFSRAILIGNSMLLKCYLEKTRTSEFFKHLKIARVRRTSTIWGIWKTHECMFISKLAREINLLLGNNIHDKVMQNWATHLRHVQNNLFTQLLILH